MSRDLQVKDQVYFSSDPFPKVYTITAIKNYPKLTYIELEDAIGNKRDCLIPEDLRLYTKGAKNAR